MTVEEKRELAASLKTSGKCNCCQAVLIALKDELNLSDNKLLSLGAGFCAGMGNMSATCGALVGAVMALGLKTEGEKTLKLARIANEEFKESSKALVCKDLKTIKDGKPLCACDDCVRNAISAFYKALKNLGE